MALETSFTKSPRSQKSKFEIKSYGVFRKAGCEAAVLLGGSALQDVAMPRVRAAVSDLYSSKRLVLTP
jgi:hypothetical protein